MPLFSYTNKPKLLSTHAYADIQKHIKVMCNAWLLTGCIDENGGAAGLLLRSLKACSYDVRSSVINNIIFCGGGALIAGSLIVRFSQSCRVVFYVNCFFWCCHHSTSSNRSIYVLIYFVHEWSRHTYISDNVSFNASYTNLPGLPEAVCLRASQVAVTAPEFIPQLAQVSQTLPSGKLTLLPSPFRRDWLVWAGASLFASVKVVFWRTL